MNVVLDACSVINLLNGNILQKALTLPNYSFFIGDLLLEQELLIDLQKIKIQTFIENNKIIVLESVVSVSEFSTIKSTYNLGVGESECIAICKKFNYCIVTDDSAAREAAKIELGNEKVTGSIGILQQLTAHKISTADDAYGSYLTMKRMGAFLPYLDISSFG